MDVLINDVDGLVLQYGEGLPTPESIEHRLETWAEDDPRVAQIVGNWRLRRVEADGTLTCEAEPAPQPGPDIRGLMLAIYSEFGKTKARALGSKYPDAQESLNASNWTLARAAVEDMKTNGDITQTQYDRIQVLLTEYHIPIS